MSELEYPSRRRFAAPKDEVGCMQILMLRSAPGERVSKHEDFSAGFGEGAR